MRPIKRVLLFAGEVGVLMFGFALSLTLSIALALHFDSAENPYGGVLNVPAQAVVYFGWLLTIVGFVALRRKTRPWKIEYDAVGWGLAQTERRLHPLRVRYKRRAMRILIWLPSTIAAGVLFFLPVATHVFHPRSHYLKHYQVSIPWTDAVFSMPGLPASYSYVLAFAGGSSQGRFGVTPFWESRQLSSEMQFGSIDPGADFAFLQKYEASRHAGAARELRREFSLGGVAFTCWQYVHPYRYPRVGPSSTEPLWWNIDCMTDAEVRRQNMYALFFGREQDIPSFYKIIEGVKPLK